MSAGSVLVINGHPRGRSSLCEALVKAYAEGANREGWHAVILRVAELEFDPVLHSPSPNDQPLETELDDARRELGRADHIVFVYPTWWGTVPALLKGFLDRILLPGWAFRETESGTGFEGLLKGKTAELITTMDTPGLAYGLLYGAPGHRAMADATLGFCGIEVTRITRFGPIKASTRAQRSTWIAYTEKLGCSLKSGPRSAAQRLWRLIEPWLVALRLQFYPMTFLAYWLGAILAVGPKGLSIGSFWLGYVILFLLEAATVFTNDVYDVESDKRNRYWGPFTGGSRALVNGNLSRTTLLFAAALAGTGAVFLAAVLLGKVANPIPTGVWLSILAIAALGYTIPPLKLSHRGFGEFDVAFTHGPGVLLAGYLVQGGSAVAPLPYLVSLPLAFAVLPAILLSGIPDMEADSTAGKKTVPVRVGVRAAVILAATSAILAVVLAIILQLVGNVTVLAGTGFVAGVHLIWLLYVLQSSVDLTRRSQRLDQPMLSALTFMIWFVVCPLIALFMI